MVSHEAPALLKRRSGLCGRALSPWKRQLGLRGAVNPEVQAHFKPADARAVDRAQERLGHVLVVNALARHDEPKGARRAGQRPRPAVGKGGVRAVAPVERADLEHKQWAHRPHRPNGESPLGLMEPPKQVPLPRGGLGS